MSSEQHWEIDPESILSQRFDDEVVAINLKAGVYYSLRGAAAVVWAALEARADRRGVLEAIQATYEGDDQEHAHAVDRFLAELTTEGLITSRPGAGAAPAETKRDAAQRIAFVAPVLEKYRDMQDLLLLDPIHDVDEDGLPTGRNAG